MAGISTGRVRVGETRAGPLPSCQGVALASTSVIAADHCCPPKLVDGMAKPCHDDEQVEKLEPYFLNRNSRPIFTRFTPLYSMMSAVA